MVGAFNFVAFSNLGLSVFEQIPLVNEFGHTAAETAWPPIVTGLAGVCGAAIAQITDRFNFFGFGHRLPYIILGQTIMTIAYLIISFYPPTQGPGWAIYLAMYLVRGFSFTLASSAMGGFIVDANIRERIGFIQGIRAIGSAFGVCCAFLLAVFWLLHLLPTPPPLHSHAWAPHCCAGRGAANHRGGLPACLWPHACRNSFSI